MALIGTWYYFVFHDQSFKNASIIIDYDSKTAKYEALLSALIDIMPCITSQCTVFTVVRYGTVPKTVLLFNINSSIVLRARKYLAYCILNTRSHIECTLVYFVCCLLQRKGGKSAFYSFKGF